MRSPEEKNVEKNEKEEKKKREMVRNS